MEFLQLLLVFISMIIAYKCPKKEKLAYGILLCAWIFMLYLYIGHKSSNLLSAFNL